MGEIDGNRIYIKRDDLIPFSFGGNKARKAFNFFQVIDAGKYDCVVTYGSSSSNHCRIVVNIAASRGLPCTVIEPEEASEPSFNSKLMKLFGAEIIVVPVNKVHDTIEMKLGALRSTGEKPCFIPGGSHGNLGTQAYLDCYEEICSYEAGHNIHFDYIFFASGTGTTQAGLICGQQLHGDERKIVGISIARKNPIGRQTILDSVFEYFETLNLHFTERQIEEATVFVDDYTGNGYGGKNPEVTKTISDMMIKYGIPMDTTYTGKAFVGMKKYLCKQSAEDKGKTILFIHTGGAPLFFDDLKEF